MQSIGLIERDFCATIAEIKKNIPVDTFIGFLQCKQGLYVDDIILRLFSNWGNICNEIYHQTEIIQSIPPKTIDDADRINIALRRLNNLEKIIANIRNQKEILDDVDLTVSPALLALNAYRYLTMAEGQASLAESCTTSGKSSTHLRLQTSVKTPAELLALHEREPQRWTFQALGNEYYPYVSEKKETKRSWAWRQVNKARKRQTPR